MLKRIEDLVGFPLFERRRPVAANPGGTPAFREGAAHQARIEGLHDVIEQIGKGGYGAAPVRPSPSLARQLMAICLARLREAFPEVKSMSLSDIVDYVALGIGECFFTMTPIVNPVVVQSLPVTLGHELAGRVCAIGPGVKDLTIGQGVIVIPFVTCGVCPSCRAATTTIAWTCAASG